MTLVCGFVCFFPIALTRTRVTWYSPGCHRVQWNNSACTQHIQIETGFSVTAPWSTVKVYSDAYLRGWCDAVHAYNMHGSDQPVPSIPLCLEQLTASPSWETPELPPLSACAWVFLTNLLCPLWSSQPPVLTLLFRNTQCWKWCGLLSLWGVNVHTSAGD